MLWTCRFLPIVLIFRLSPHKIKEFAMALGLDAGQETVYNRPMELAQLKNLFTELKQKASDLRGFL